MKYSRVRPPYRKALLASLILSCSTIAPLSFAAEEPSETIIVTGSRIRQAETEGHNPVSTLTREDLDKTGLKTVGDILMRLSSTGSALNTRFNSSGNFGFPPDGGGIGAGAAEVSLRHLGAKRTLVLVDGVRWVNGSSASGVANSVDINTIPISIVDRIEILEDGASSIYGSDAIAGVVNIITRKNFDGFEMNLYGGAFDEGDGETSQIDLSFGASGDKHNVFFSISHYDQQTVNSSDRTLAGVPKPNTGLTRGSSGTPQGRFLFFGADNDLDGNPDFINLTINDGVTGIPFFDPTDPGGANDDFHGFTNNDRFNYAAYNLYVTPSQRTSLFGQADYQVSDNVNFYVKGLYNNRKSVNQAAPEPIFIGPEAGTGGLGDLVTVDVTNPYNPFGMTLDASNFIFAGRRPIEGGARVFKQNVDTSYIGVGFTGEFASGEHTYYWDVNYNYGKNRADQVKTGGYNIRHIMNALGPLTDCQAISGCVPLNLFGGQGDGSGTITQDMLDYIQFVQKDVSENVIDSFSANITGELFDMPAGPLAFAAGFETRDYRGFFEPDAVVVAGDSNGVPSSPTSGSYDVDELYAEFKVPLLADAAMADELSITLAVRNSDYSTFGSETTSKFGLLWRVSDQFIFRASKSEGFRAPSIGELFSSSARFDAELSDLCSLNQTSGVSQQIQDNCAALGVPASYEQLNNQISVTTGGNSELEAEKADSFTAGFVYSPSWVSNADWVNTFDIKFTYYKHEVEDAVQALDAQDQLNLCIQTLDAGACNGIGRAATGGINAFNNRLTNIGLIETSGYDLNFTYSGPERNWGRMSIDWTNTFISEYSEDGNDIAGLERNDTGIPDWKSTLNIGWSKNSWGVNWTMRYTDSLTESCSDFLDGSPASLTNLGLCSNPSSTADNESTNKLSGGFYNDLQVVYYPENSNLEFTFGINNIFNEDPPACYSCSLNGYDPSVYDPEGMFGYLAIKLKL